MKIKENIKNTVKNNTNNIFYKSNPSGISLIVLVITIIVIIILATAIIVTLLGNNPIVEANKARYESDRDNMQSIFTNTVTKVMAQKNCTMQIRASSLNTVTSGVSSTTGDANYTLNDGANTSGKIVFDNSENKENEYYTGKQLPIYKSGKTTWYVDEDGIISLRVGDETYGDGEQVKKEEQKPPIPQEPEKLEVGEIVKDIAKEYTDKNGNKATIPIDFAIVPGKDVIKDGLVISDVANDTEDVGNQFVWIPVDDISTFVREAGYYYGQIQTLPNGTIELAKCEEPYSSATSSEKKEYENMINSVNEYKGFYIGRYEISQSEDGLEKSQSKKNKIPLVNIKFANSMTDLSNGIVEVARSMYPEVEATKGNVVSTLVYGVAWDEIIRFLKTNEKYKNIDKDSSEFGNYEGTNTGYRKEYSMNNIYDLAGNVWEWTMESYIGKSADSNLGRILRGGVYYYDGSAYPISTRSSYTNILQSSDAIGGRIQLYIK